MLSVIVNMNHETDNFPCSNMASAVIWMQERHCPQIDSSYKPDINPANFTNSYHYH